MKIFYNFKAWVICLISALFFLYEFVQINMFNAIDPYIIEAFQLNATKLGWLSSCYFYTTVGFLLPAGLILDYFSPKRVILITLSTCIIGIAGFSFSNTICFAIIFRLLEGIGSAFCFLGSFRIAANWFPAKRIAMVTGVIVTIGMLGGIIAQTPLTFLVGYAGWRKALLIDAGFGIFILFLIFVFVQDSPNKGRDKYLLDITEYWKKLRAVYLFKHNWFCGIYTCLLNLPLVLLGALWGNMYLENIYHFSHLQASNIIAMIFFGTIISSPLVGYISDFFSQRKIPMIIGGVLSIIFSIFIIYPINPSYHSFIVIFFLLGLFSGTQILGYPAAAEQNHSNLSGTSASVVSFTTMSGYIIFQPLFGWIMDYKHPPVIINNTATYSLESYQHALMILPVFFIVAIFISFFLKKNY
ncbi:MAG TPA: MFS transporter [Gammaproteobacteria bacterium]|nr:MFS transporter [Gammaproteobacteria bacterium]